MMVREILHAHVILLSDLKVFSLSHEKIYSFLFSCFLIWSLLLDLKSSQWACRPRVWPASGVLCDLSVFKERTISFSQPLI